MRKSTDALPKYSAAAGPTNLLTTGWDAADAKQGLQQGALSAFSDVWSHMKNGQGRAAGQRQASLHQSMMKLDGQRVTQQYRSTPTPQSRLESRQQNGRLESRQKHNAPTVSMFGSGSMRRYPGYRQLPGAGTRRDVSGSVPCGSPDGSAKGSPNMGVVRLRRGVNVAQDEKGERKDRGGGDKGKRARTPSGPSPEGNRSRSTRLKQRPPRTRRI
eukprot:gene6337-2961_t